MFGLVRMAILAVGFTGIATTAQAAKQEFPPLPIEHLDVLVVRTNETLQAAVDGMPNGYYVAGLYISDPGYQQRLKEANEAIAPAREVLAGYEFNAVIESKLRKAILDAGLSTDTEWKVVATDKPEPISASQDVLLAYTMMMLSPGFRSLDFQVNLHLDRREPAGERKPRIRKRFIRSYRFQFVVDPVVGNPLSFWNRMSRAQWEQINNEATDHILAMIVDDFSQTGRENWWSEPVDSRTVFMGRVMHGHATPREDGAMWLIAGKNWGRVMMGFKPVR